MAKTAKEMVAEANGLVVTLTAEEAAKRAGELGTVFLDVREGEELRRTGKLKGAVHIPRGFLEFQADPSSPSHNPALNTDRQVVVYCGSGSRSALAAKTLKELGYSSVAHVAGGFQALQAAGTDIEGPG